MVAPCKTKTFIKYVRGVQVQIGSSQENQPGAKKKLGDWPRAVRWPAIVTRLLGLPTGINRHVQLTVPLLMSP